MKPEAWSAAEVEMLRDLAPNTTSTVIADKLNKAFGTGRTRNAVIGAAHRLRISLGGRPQAKISQRKKRHMVMDNFDNPAPDPVFEKIKIPTRPKPKRQKLPPRFAGPPARTPAPMGDPPFSLFELDHTSCLWIAGDPRDPRPFECIEPKVHGSPYCKRHSKMAWQQVARARLKEIGL